jgi:DNA-binding transcriptional ArsR family regulator
MRNLPEPDVDDIDLASVLHALADPSRLAIVATLARLPEQSCDDLGGLAGLGAMAKSTRSHHLRVLREAGVTSARYEGTRKVVWLRREDLDRRFPGLLDAVLAGVDTDVPA